VLEQHIRSLKSKYLIDLCVVNGENAAHGKGITQEIAKQFYHLGTDVITLGNHAWDNKDILNYIEREERLIRPYNFPPPCPGKGYVTVNLSSGRKVTVAQLCCRLFMDLIDCPFRAAERLLEEVGTDHPILIDLHGEATSEKIALGWFLDGRVSAIVGTHTHIPTADERVLPKGTAYITDIGMTGAYDSVIGMDPEIAIERFITNMRKPYTIAGNDNVKISAVVITLNDATGLAESIQRIMLDMIDEDSQG
jgi:metallophosphoesterase (TIGR00282 family)